MRCSRPAPALLREIEVAPEHTEVGVTGLNRKLEDNCRISRDTCDNLNAERLENCDRATVRYILIFPQEPPIIRLT